jgi:hypothetical protein
MLHCRQNESVAIGKALGVPVSFLRTKINGKKLQMIHWFGIAMVGK